MLGLGLSSLFRADVDVHHRAKTSLPIVAPFALSPSRKRDKEGSLAAQGRKSSRLYTFLLLGKGCNGLILGRPATERVDENVIWLQTFKTTCGACFECRL